MNHFTFHILIKFPKLFGCFFLHVSIFLYLARDLRIFGVTWQPIRLTWPIKRWPNLVQSLVTSVPHVQRCHGQREHYSMVHPISALVRARLALIPASITRHVNGKGSDDLMWLLFWRCYVSPGTGRYQILAITVLQIV